MVGSGGCGRDPRRDRDDDRRRRGPRVLADPERGQGARRARLRGQRGTARLLLVDERGAWSGFDVDFCRAVAAAIFGDPNRVRLVPLSADARFQALKDGKIDVLSRNSTWTMGRETEFGLDLRRRNLLRRAGLHGSARAAAHSALELDGAKVCVQSGTTSIDNLADFFAANQMALQTVVVLLDRRLDQELRRRPLLRPDQRSLPALRSAPAPREAEGPRHPRRRDLEGAARAGGAAERSAMDRDRAVGPFRHAQRRGARRRLEDDRPGAAIAEARGDAPRRDERAISARRSASSNAWAANVIRSVGNYGEVFERNLGAQTPLAIPRGLNQLWNAGGIQYAPPIR